MDSNHHAHHLHRPNDHTDAPSIPRETLLQKGSNTYVTGDKFLALENDQDKTDGENETTEDLDKTGVVGVKLGRTTT